MIYMSYMDGVHHALRLKYDYETSDSVKYKENYDYLLFPISYLHIMNML